MEFSEIIAKMNRQQLASYMDGLVSRLDNDGWDDEQAQEFSALMHKLRDELSDGEPALPKIYKVFFRHKDFESNIKYFTTLRGAKREIKDRFNKLRKNPFVAPPYEIVTSRAMEGSVAADTVQSIITNQDFTKKAPGRFKFYEIRMMGRRKVTPIQLVLTQVQVEPTVQNPKSKPTGPTVVEFPKQPF